MEYRVHVVETAKDDPKTRLEDFLNGLDGEVVSVIPMVKKLSLFQIYGATSRLASFHRRLMYSQKRPACSIASGRIAEKSETLWALGQKTSFTYKRKAKPLVPISHAGSIFPSR